MSIYHCEICEGLKDADHDGCNESPNDECECVYDNCYANLGD